MENTPVNWNAVDALVLDYAEAEQLLDGTDGSHNSSIEVRQVIEQIRGLIEEGCITEALDLIRQQAPTVLEDQRLTFRLHKQKFIELLRSGSVDARAQAIHCSRTVLGPYALDAYPEAYEEFKRLLLALIYSKDDESSPVAEEWSEARRADLAATIASVLKAQLHAYEPLFSLAFRYLISMHNGYCFRQGVPSSIAHIAAMTLQKEKDPPATTQEVLLEAPKFSEGDVQALAHAVELSRQGAIDSLRYTGGDLITAFKNELSRMRLNTCLLDELVREYCVYRGLIDCDKISICKSSASSVVVSELKNGLLNLTESNEVNEGASDAVDASMDTVTEEATICNAESTRTIIESPVNEPVAEVQIDDTSQVQASVEQPVEENTSNDSSIECRHLEISSQDVTMEDLPDSHTDDRGVELSDETKGHRILTANENLCSTSGMTDTILTGMKNRRARQKEKFSIPHRRWRGRQGQMQTTQMEKSCTVHLQDQHMMLGANRESNEFKILIEERPPHELELEKYGIAVEIRQLASEGMIGEVIEEVKRLNPHFFEHNPHLFFQLKQVEFLKLVEDGDYNGALGVARADMGPLAAKYSDLLKPLKETVLALARPQGEAPVKPTPPSLLAASLQVALGASLGIAEPLLMKIMRATLYTHTEWFKLQMCPDPFAEVLSINALKETDIKCSGSSSRDSKVESTSHVTGSVSTTWTSEGSMSQQLDSSRDGALFDEMSILTVMEWMAVPRGDAIQLLAQYNGSVDDVFAHILS